MNIYINKVNDYKKVCNELDKKWYVWCSRNKLTDYLYIKDVEPVWITLFLEERNRVSMIHWKPTRCWFITAKQFLPTYDL